jgi:hypothetical protein
MELPTWTPDGRMPLPPPLWLVSSGLRTVGPVSTHNLVRSAKVTGVPDDLWARDVKACRWRTLTEIREIRAIDGGGDRSESVEIERLATLLRLSDDADESLGLALRLAARKLGAGFGFIHRFEAGHHVPITRFALGLGTENQLGAPVAGNDWLTHVARTRNLALGKTSSHFAFQDAAKRLGGQAASIAGVAMVPIALPRGDLAMLELGREDHGFRAADAGVLRDLARGVAGRLAARRRAS